MSAGDTLGSATVSVTGSSLSTPLMDLLLVNDIQPGAEPSYQACKTLYTDHPLGGKMAKAPITMAQSKPRVITVQEAPAKVAERFKEVWEKKEVDQHICTFATLTRAYGIAANVLGVTGKPSNVPLDMKNLWKQEVFFNELDPLNAAGSLVLSQVPNSAMFQSPVTVTSNGETYHPSRFVVMQNEEPIYLDYTSSGFGFTGRSVYQRALYPLKSFIRSMIADDLIATKLALLVAKQEQPGSVADAIMTKIAGWKRSLLKQAQTGNVISIGIEESVETLDMQNVDGAGTYSRNNILKNIATAADMPAKLLENETMVEGFGEGTEDAKSIVGYIEGIQKWLKRVYAWYDNIIRYLAWTPDFFEQMQKEFPDQYGGRDFDEVFLEWRANFQAEWPSLIREADSDKVKVEETKAGTIISVLEQFLPEMDPENKCTIFEWACANLSENKQMFPHELVIDFDTLKKFQETKQKQADDQQKGELKALTQPPVSAPGGKTAGGIKKPKAKLGKAK